MVDVLALALRFVLAAVFAIAAVAKLRDRQGTAEALEGFGVPQGLVPSTTYLLPAVEALAALLLILPATYFLGATLSLALLVAFTAAILVNLAKGNRVACRCFGEMSSKPIGGRTVGRNLGLCVQAAYVLLAAPSSVGQAERWFRSMSPEDAKLSIGVGILFVGLGATIWFLVRVLDQITNLRLRLEALERAGQPQGLEPGTDAPVFELPTTDGTVLGLAHLLQRGKPIVLTFTDPNCGPCQTLVPQLAMWQQSLSNVFTVGIVSRGRMNDNKEHAAEHHLSEVIVQRRDEVAGSFKAAGTPNAVRISAEGKIESFLAQGVDEITALFETLVAEHAQALWEQGTGESIPRPHVGLPIGAEAPDTVVQDLDGNEHRLPDLLQSPTMFVFWSPRCTFCHQVVDEMRQLEARLQGDRQIIFATTGTAEENRFMGFRSSMIFDPGFNLGSHFEAEGTPAALVFEEGKVATGVQAGVDGILNVAEGFAGPGPQPVETPSLRPSNN